MSIPLPKLSRARRGRQNGDPVHSERGRSVSQRKAGREPGFTPTEQRVRERCMRQFMRNPEGGGVGNSTAYVNSEVWCRHPGCKLMNGSHTHG